MTAQPPRFAPRALSGEILPPADERHDSWTPARQAEFLRTLAATHSVRLAAKAVGMSRQSAYKLRQRMKNEPFDLAWRAALGLHYDALLEAAVERAINGVEVPHFHKGELIHTSRRYDDHSAVALLALRKRLEPAPVNFWRLDAEGIAPQDFHAMVARIESGRTLWRDGDGEGDEDCDGDDEA